MISNLNNFSFILNNLRLHIGLYINILTEETKKMFDHLKFNNKTLQREISIYEWNTTRDCSVTLFYNRRYFSINI